MADTVSNLTKIHSGPSKVSLKGALFLIRLMSLARDKVLPEYGRHSVLLTYGRTIKSLLSEKRKTLFREEECG